MNANYLFNVNNWYDKFYSSQDDINNAFIKGLINREVIETTYGANYIYTTKEGVSICKFYKDSTFGFCSQAYGIQVPPPFKMFPLVAKELADFTAKYFSNTL